ncbi:hypothetical protein AJ80_01269 [Polytolypa hystricis UAMH7299]|uniref:Major facilitator superfamily (MFS) profile domain-containing protein n=1 Tax=Polytolypa hystricis (strain UAMH7299) TaxID=1447883 RepID=A0A2B7Z1H0_POLH7|nr:hypothetical protein AJ80_01269 [Polytolypa hystricis UAMH7299]
MGIEFSIMEGDQGRVETGRMLSILSNYTSRHLVDVASSTNDAEIPTKMNGQDHYSPRGEDPGTIERQTSRPTINFEQAVIDNPLKRYAPEQLDEVATRFAKHFKFTGLEDLFRKAARCARDPKVAHTVPSLTPAEKEVLKYEGKIKFWKQPKQLKIAIITCCLGAIIQGWNQTGINGANIRWPDVLNPRLHIKKTDPNYDVADVWYYAGVNAITYFTAALVGAWISDPLQELFFGRRAAMLFAGLAIFSSTIGGAFVHTVPALLGTRLVLGIGMGCKASVIPIYSAEVSPGNIRGTLGVNWQIMDTVGIALGFAANLILSVLDENLAWRCQMASGFVPTLPFLVLIYVCPESPRFLLKKRDYHGAYESLLALRGVPLLAARDLFYMHVQLLAETKLAYTDLGDVGENETYQDELEKITYVNRVLQLVRVPRVRRSAMAAFAIMISQQLCGVNVFAFYSSTFFNDLNDDAGRKAMGLSLGTGNSRFGIPAYWLIEKWGRRALLLISIPGMAVSLLACGASFYIDNNTTRVGVVAFFIFVFMFFYSPGMGPVPFAMSSEIFMSVNREVGMSWAVWVNLFAAGILTLLVPPLTAILGGHGTTEDNVDLSHVQGRILFVFAVLNVVAFTLCYFLVPETSGATISKSASNMEYMSLEELNYIFDTPTSKHVEYQTKIILPWAINRLIPRRPREPRPEPLYRWAKSQAQEEVEMMEAFPLEDSDSAL